MPPQATQDIASRIVAAIPKVERHLWFASMASSQALSQSVFGGLEATGRLQALEGLDAEDGYPAFFGSFSGHRLKLEHAVTTLNEPRPTSLDAFLDGATRVAVEVKFTENEFGRCSRPRIPSRDARFEQDHCDGSYTRQRMRTRNCSLSERGIRYWDFVPELFAWDAGIEHRPCPLSAGYQLVRNVLAACVRADGSIDTDNAHAVIVYDNRNPAFAAGGEANRQWWLVVTALRSPRVLRRVSWQSLAAHLRQFDDLDLAKRRSSRQIRICRDGLELGEPVLAIVGNHPPFLLQLDQMRQHRARGGGMQALVDIGIHARDHFGDRVDAVAQAGDDLRLAVEPVIEIGLQERLGIADRRAMRRIENRDRRARAACAGSPCMRAMSPSGGVTTVVDQPIT